MSASLDNPTGVITFTPKGEAALDQLAAAVVDQCDGTAEGVATVLDRVLQADIEELAGWFSAAVGTGDPMAAVSDETELVPELVAESPDAAARRRLGGREPSGRDEAGPRARAMGR